MDIMLSHLQENQRVLKQKFEVDNIKTFITTVVDQKNSNSMTISEVYNIKTRLLQRW